MALTVAIRAVLALDGRYGSQALSASSGRVALWRPVHPIRIRIAHRYGGMAQAVKATIGSAELVVAI